MQKQRAYWFSAAAAIALGMAGPLQAQTTPPQPQASKPTAPKPAPAKKPRAPAEDADDADDQTDPDVVVTGHRVRPLPGAVVGDVEPEVQFSPADIQSFGVSTVTELVNELAPEARSDRGRTQTSPVILLNGHRISSFNEVQNIPTEAILRVDILPEEAALKYGYSADQRVINIVLKPRFRAITDEATGGGSTRGADASAQGEVDQFATRRNNRLNLDLKYATNRGIDYADRGLTPNAASTPFDTLGNVIASPPGGQIDPGLSALAGQPVVLAGVPASAANGQKPALAAFAPTAGTANVTDVASDRSLTPVTQSLTANAVAARPLFWGVNATGNVTLGATTSDTLLGLPGAGLTVPAGDPFSPFSGPVTVNKYLTGQAPLRQSADGWTAHLGSTLNRDSGDWRLSLTDAYDHGDTVTRTGTGIDTSAIQGLLSQASPTLDPFGPISASMAGALPLSTARAITDSGNIQILANGPLLKVPAGALYMSGKIGDAESSETSNSDRNGVSQTLRLARNTANARLNLDLPLTSRSHHVLEVLGDFNVNVNTAIDYLSDFGALTTLGYGINWTPIPGYTLQVNETHDHQAPTLAQLEGPVIVTPNAPVFDYTAGQTVNVTQVSGSNPALVADSRELLKIGVTLKPWTSANFSFTANYIDSRIDNPIATFPAASAAIEAAFPNRFVRNAQGELDEEDISPVNFARQDRQELRWGFNYSRPVGKPVQRPVFDRQASRQRRQGQDGQRPRGGPPGGGPPDGGPGGDGPAPGGAANAPGGAPGAPGQGQGGPGGARGFGGGGGGGGRGGGRGGFGGGGFGQQTTGQFQIALYHTVIFKDQYLVRPGGPVLDLLGGSPAGGSGGQYQHEIEAQIGYTDRGYGVRMSADWKSATQVTGGAIGETGDLEFSSVATINLRLWDDFAQQRNLVMRYPILRGTRVTLNINNLFDQAIKVKDTAGLTPLIYQSAYLNPAGRVMSLSLRKLFY